MAETSKTVDQALGLLRELAAAGPGSVQELTRRRGSSRTVTYRLLSTLEAHGFVRRRGGTYVLGAALVELAGHVESDLRRAARAQLEALAAASGETAVLTVREHAEAVAVDQVVSTEQVVQVHYRPGLRHPLHLGAHGKAILASLPAAEQAAVLVDVEDRPSVEAALVRVRADGHAVTHDELQVGAWGLAAPVRLGGEVIASIGIVAPVQRHPDGQALVQVVMGAATATAAALGGSAPQSSADPTALQGAGHSTLGPVHA